MIMWQLLASGDKSRSLWFAFEGFSFIGAVKWATLFSFATWLTHNYVRFDRHFAFFFSSFKFPFLWGNYLLDYTVGLCVCMETIHIFYYLKNIFIFFLFLYIHTHTTHKDTIIACPQVVFKGKYRPLSLP